MSTQKPKTIEEIVAASVAPTSAQLANAIATIAAALVARPASAEAPDALVRIAAEPLAAFGLELRPVLALIDAGKLKVVRIGRARFTTTSRLVALVDELDVAPTPKREAHRLTLVESPKSDLEQAVARAARRRSATPLPSVRRARPRREATPDEELESALGASVRAARAARDSEGS